MCSPSATAIFVGGVSLFHLPPKFGVTFTFTATGTEFGNSAKVHFILNMVYNYFRKNPIDWELIRVNEKTQTCGLSLIIFARLIL